MTALRPDLSIDADVLMNVFATGAAREILRATSDRVIICPRVEREAMWVEGDELGSRVAVDLAPLVRGGVVEPLMPTAAELALFVELARELDDGEAQALAVAQMRGMVLASDDRKAGRVASALSVAVMGTPELVVAWVDAGAPSPRVAEAITRIEQRAHFVPRASHPLAAVWRQLRDG